MDHIGERLKKLRTITGLSQKKVAEFLQKDQSFVVGYESESQSISSDALDSLSSLFCCPLQTIFSDVDAAEAIGISYTKDDFTQEDIVALATVNRIVLNQLEMDKLLQGL